MTTTGDGERAFPVVASARCFHVGVEVSGGCAVISPHGELDLGAVDRLEDVVAAVLGVGGLWQIEIDGADLGFVDVVGVGALVRAHAAAGRHGVHCRLVRVSPALRRVLELTGDGPALADHALN